MREGAASRLPSLHQHRQPVCPLGLLRPLQGHSHPEGDHQILRDHRLRLHGRGDLAEGHHNQHHWRCLHHGELSLSPEWHSHVYLSMNLLRFAFWNVNKRDLTRPVSALAKSTKADVIILTENLVLSDRTLDALRKNVSETFFIPNVQSEHRFHCFSRSSEIDMSEVHSADRIRAYS